MITIDVQIPTKTFGKYLIAAEYQVKSSGGVV